MEMSDELRAEYDLRRLRVRKVGPGRKSFGQTIIHLEPDVAEVFPNSESVNEALRFLIRIAKDNQFDDWLEGDPRFLRRIQSARESIRAGRGIKLEDVEL